jgi:serine/threonine-protein kinase PRP4
MRFCRNSPNDGKDETKDTEMSDAQVPTQQPLDEAALLEERRKRREAIKAKYKGQATPLLVSALHLKTPTSATPTPGPLVTDTPLTPGM